MPDDLPNDLVPVNPADQPLERIPFSVEGPVTGPVNPADQPLERIPFSVEGPVTGPLADAMSSRGRVGKLLDVFGQGLADGWGIDPVGPSEEWNQMIKEKGDVWGVFKAFHDAIIRPAAIYADAVVRFPGALIMGANALANETPLPHDTIRGPIEMINSLAGSPFHFGVPLPKEPNIKIVQSVENAPLAIEPVAPGISVYHGSGRNFDKFSNEYINAGEGSQAFGHGIYTAENPNVAKTYVGLSGPIRMTEDVKSALKSLDYLGFDSAGEAINAIRKDGPDWKKSWDLDPEKRELSSEEIKAGATIDEYLSRRPVAPKEDILYQAKLNADKDHFIDWHESYDGQSAFIQDKLKELGIWPAHVNKMWAALNKPRDLKELNNPSDVARLREQGIKGVKFLDQGSRGADSESKTFNYVVFDANDLEITHKNETPIFKDEPHPLLQVANELGIIGKEEPLPKPNETPIQSAARVFKSEPKEGEAPTASGKAGNIRVNDIDTTEAARDVIRQAATDNGGFMGVRQGLIPIAHMDALSEVTGIPLEKLMENREEISKRLATDKQAEMAYAGMKQLSQDVADSFAKARASGEQVDIDAADEAMSRYYITQEWAAGINAQFGKTGNIIQKFVKGQTESEKGLKAFMQRNKGKSAKDIMDIVNASKDLDPNTQLPTFLEKAKPDTSWPRFVWMNGLLSGFITHSKYVLGNGAFGIYDNAVVPVVAGAIGKMRELMSKEEIERVYMGEGPAALWGLIAGVPDALIAAKIAVQTGQSVLLPYEIATGVNPYTLMKPISGKIGKLVGLPSDVAAGIHTFYKFLGDRAMIERLSYRQAAKEGHSILSNNFWERQKNLANFPTDGMLQAAMENGQRLAFTNKLGTKASMFQSTINKIPPLKFLAPFTHIAINLLKKVEEATPLSYLDKDMRDNLKGVNGDAVRDTQFARIATGSALMLWATNMVINDQIAGDGPVDTKERRNWQLSHPLSNAVNINGHWHSFDRLGPVGDILKLAVNLNEVAEAMSNKEYGEAAARAAIATSHWIGQAGLQGFGDLAQALRDPNRYGKDYVANMASTALPFSSFLRQTASSMDPHIRETNTWFDGFKKEIPGLRNQMYPMRDWSGMPRANPDYEGSAKGPLSRQGIVPNPLGSAGELATSVIKDVPAVTDPIDLEMKSLGMHPARPEPIFHYGSLTNGGTVKLNPEQYEKFQSTAGSLTRQAIRKVMRAPDYYTKSVLIRTNLINGAIAMSRKLAERATIIAYPDIIQQAIQQKTDLRTGAKTK